MGKSHEAQALLDKAAAEVGKLPVGRWAGWAVYLLEALEAQARTPAEEWPTGIRDALRVRLTEGRW